MTPPGFGPRSPPLARERSIQLSYGVSLSYSLLGWWLRTPTKLFLYVSLPNVIERAKKSSQLTRTKSKEKD